MLSILNCIDAKRWEDYYNPSPPTDAPSNAGDGESREHAMQTVSEGDVVFGTNRENSTVADVINRKDIEGNEIQLRPRNLQNSNKNGRFTRCLQPFVFVLRKWFNPFLAHNLSRSPDGNQYEVIVKKPTKNVREWIALNFGFEHVTAAMHRRIVMFLRFIFRTSFLNLLMVFVIFYFFWVVLFAYFIWISMKYYPNCLSTYEDGLSEKENTSEWQDAFALSWTTFSTVGYGHIYPSLSEQGMASKCGWVISLCSIEAFIGILFSETCGALFFAKIFRVQMNAQVLFSEGLALSFSKEVKNISVYTDVSDSDEYGDYCRECFECPTLTVRVVNENANITEGSVLIEASVIATINGSEDPSNKISELPSENYKSNLKSSRILASLIKRDDGRDCLNNVESGQKRILFENSENLLFNKCWMLKHKLDKRSPLVRPDIKEKMIESFDGTIYWPCELAGEDGSQKLHCCEGISNSLSFFKHMVVSINALSEASGQSVFSNKVFSFGQILVGYEHVDMSYLEKSSKIKKLDFTLINDVIRTSEIDDNSDVND